MRFPGIRLVEQTEQKISSLRVCLEEKKIKKTSDCNSRAVLLIKEPTKTNFYFLSTETNLIGESSFLPMFDQITIT